MGFAEDANALILQKKFEDLESLWMSQIESDPSDVEAFTKALIDLIERASDVTKIGHPSELPA